jgi:hypothetical protein
LSVRPPVRPSRTANSRATLLSSVYCSDLFYLPDYTALYGGSNTLHYRAAAAAAAAAAVPFLLFAYFVIIVDS